MTTPKKSGWREELEQKLLKVCQAFEAASPPNDNGMTLEYYLFVRDSFLSFIAARDEAHKEELKDEYARGFNDGANEQYKIISKQQL